MKKVILVSMMVGTIVLIFSTYSVGTGLCDNSDYACRYFFDAIEHVSYFFPVILFFSIVTYRSEAIFRKWWAFARFAIPVAFILIIAINFGVLNSPTQGSFGWGGMINDAINIWASILIYAVFIIGSIIQISRGYFAKTQTV